MDSNSKKGDVTGDVLLVVVMLFVLSFVAMIGLNIFGQVNTDIQADTSFSSNAKATSQDIYDRFPSWADGAFALFLTLFWVFTILASFLVRTHPAFLVISIVLLMFVFFVGAQLGNSYEELSADSEFSATSFPITNFVMSHLLQVVIAMAISIVIALYAKQARGGL